MEKCLVTKLKGSVQNNNLPVFNVITLDFAGVSGQSQLVVGANSENVIVTFAASVHDSSPSGTQIAANTPITVDANTRKGFFTVNNQAAVDNFVRIENIYNLESLISTSGFSFNQTAKSGLPSLAYLDNLVQFGGMMESINIFNCKKLFLGAVNPNAEYIVEGDTIQYVTSAGGFISDGPDSIQKLSMRWKGDVKDFPAQLRYYKQQSGQTFGELANFVAKARLAGRTTGYLVLAWLDNGFYDANITLNGVSLKDNEAVTPVTIDDTSCAVLQWDASTISFGTSKPADFSQYEGVDSNTYWQPYE